LKKIGGGKKGDQEICDGVTDLWLAAGCEPWLERKIRSDDRPSSSPTNLAQKNSALTRIVNLGGEDLGELLSLSDHRKVRGVNQWRELGYVKMGNET